MAINGFGRIGRAVFRALQSARFLENLRVTHINDISDMEKLAYLLRRDSRLGAFSENLYIKGDRLIINGEQITLSSFQTPRDSSFTADIVIESSGAFLDTKTLESYLENGAKKVILSAPPSDDMKIFVRGVNERDYRGESIISNASCSSNAIAPIIAQIATKREILGGRISIIHPFNSDQSLLDSPHKASLRLSRNATLNIIPTSSSIGAVLGRLFPKMQGRFHGDSVRVPTSLVAFAVVDLVLDRAISKDEILGLSFDGEIIGFDSENLVSSDFVGDRRSAIIASDLIVANDNLCRINLWFDNESGYAHRLCEMAEIVSAK